MHRICIDACQFKVGKAARGDTISAVMKSFRKKLFGENKTRASARVGLETPSRLETPSEAKEREAATQRIQAVHRGNIGRAKATMVKEDAADEAEAKEDAAAMTKATAAPALSTSSISSAGATKASSVSSVSSAAVSSVSSAATAEPHSLRAY